MKDHILECEDAIGFFQAELRGILDYTRVGGGGGVGIAERLAPEPLTVRELARDPDSGRALYRVLLALTSVGVFTEGKEGRFALTPVEDLLRTGVAGLLRDSAIMAAGSEPKNSAAFFSAAGLRLSRIVPKAHEVSVIETVTA